jgi:hypothetical protein
MVRHLPFAEFMTSLLISLSLAGRYDLLPIDNESMEWVPTRDGVIPSGRRPIEGGYEEHGARLFHAYADINGVSVPGKTGEHLVRPFSFISVVI